MGREIILHSENEELEALTCLGLTKCEAKIYLTIMLSDQSTVNMISKKSQITREQIYQNLTKLEKLGFIEKTISKPTQYKALPPKKVFSILFEKRKEKTDQIQNTINKITEKYILNQTKTDAQEEKSRFIMLSPKNASLIKRREEIETSQESTDFITSWKRFPKTVFEFKDCALESLNRGVKIRVILEKPPNEEYIQKVIWKLLKMPNYEIRYILNPPSVIIGIFDKKRIIIKTSASEGLAEVPSIWSNNPCILSVFNNYFEQTWKSAIKNNLLKH